MCIRDRIYTTEGSLAIAQAEASKTESKIDQSGAAIDVQYTCLLYTSRCV